MIARSFVFFLIACHWLLPGVAATAQTGTGLTAKYYDDQTFSTAALKTTRTDASINFNFGTTVPAGTALTAATTYSVAWTGQIEAQFSELYTFTLTADDAARLWVDDRLIVQRSFYQGNGELRGQMRLKAGQRTNLRLEYIQQTGNASVKLEWASPSQQKQLVPTNRLYPTTEVPNGGSVMREIWTGISGSSIASLTSNANYPNKPASREFLTSFECIAQNWEDSFGTRVTGFIRAPISGSYSLAVSGDDVVQLYLSTDANPSNKSLVASVTSATAFRDFSANASQQSTPRTLVAGQRYYVELLHKEDSSNDHWSVGWKQPGDTVFSVIPGTALAMPGTDAVQPATTSLFNTMAGEHPRIGVSRERFAWMKQQYDSPVSSQAKSRATAVVTSANNDVAATSTSPQIQRQNQDRIQRLAFAYWMKLGTPEAATYAEAAWTNIKYSIDHGDWTQPWCGCENGVVAIGYDWLYPYWTQARRDIMVNAMVNKGFGPGWTTGYVNNIGVLINAGHLMACLAVGTTNEGAAEPKAASAIQRLTSMINEWDPNSGAWVEGTNYGILAKWNLGQALPALEMTLGSTWGLSRVDGIWTAAREPLEIASNNRDRFTFGDVGTGSEAAIGWANWWARRYNALEVFDYSRQIGNSPLNALTLPETTLSPAGAGRPPDTCFLGPAAFSLGDNWYQYVTTLRENWTDPKATFVGCKGGGYAYSTHTMLDGGTFQINARGKRWFSDLSSQDYSSPAHNRISSTPIGLDRWDYYRNRAEGHNTLVINPGSGPDRTIDNKAKIINYQSAPNGTRSFAVYDLTPTITGATKVQRGFQLLGNRRQVLIQDEIVMPSASTVWWFAHFQNTSTTATISSDGSSVMLTQSGERLWCKILSGGGEWTVRPAEPLPTTPTAPNDSNAIYSKLAIHLTGVTNTTLAVWFVPLAPGENPPVVSPAINALNTWNLTAQNEAPIVQNSGANIVSGSSVDVDLRSLSNDDWTPVTQLTFTAGGAVGGTATLQPDGFTARFTATPGFTGLQSFTFTATDGDGSVSSPATVVIGTSPVISNWTSTVSGSWATGANWQDGTAPAGGRGADLRFFSGQTLGSLTVTATNNLAGTTSANQLALGGTGTATTVVNLDGNPLKLVRNGATFPAISLSGTTAGFRYNVANAITLDEPTTFNATGNGTFVFNGSISGSGGITRSGTTGVLILAGNNSYAGATTINSGILQIGNDGATGTPGTGPISIASGATLRIDRSGILDLQNDISGGGGLNIQSPLVTDVVQLSGNNSFAGSVTVNSGSLRITDAEQLGIDAKTVAIGGNTAALRLDGSAAPIDLPPSLVMQTSNPNGAIINEAGNNRIGGNITLIGGAGSSRYISLADSLTIEGNISPNTTGRSLDLRGAGAGVINGSLLDGSTTNTLTGVSKNEAGTWTLNGNNSFTGGTTVSGGRLVINGGHTSGAVTVSSGAVLAGRGSLTAATTVNGTLAPGDRFGTMIISNTVSFGSASKLQWELGSNSIAGDKLTSTGAVMVTAGAKIDIMLNSPGSEATYALSFWRNSRTFPVLSCASLSGTFTLGSVTGDAAGNATPTYGSFALQHTATGVNLVWTPIPGFPIIDEPLVSFIRPSASPASLPYVAQRLRVTATAAGGGTSTFAWSLIPDPDGGTGTATFENPTVADTTVTFSEKGTYTLRCTATNEAVSRSKDLIVLVEPDTTVVLQEELNGYAHSASFIQANSTAWNHGNNEKMFVGRNSNASQRAVLAFGLDSVPAGATIQSAKLDLWTDGTLGLGSVGPLDLHRLTREFQEGIGDGSSSSNGANSGVTWATYDGTNTWTTAGGTFDPTKLASIAGYDANVPHELKTFASTALATAAQTALNNSEKLNLIVLSPTSEADTTENNHTVLKSNDNAIAAERPALTLNVTFNSLPLVNPGNTTTAGAGFPLTLNGVVSFATSNQWSIVSGPGAATFGNAASAATSVNFASTGTYVLRLTAVNALGETSADLTVDVSSSPPGFAAWQASNWPGVTDLAIIGPNADPDGDGVTNAIEFNAGTDPKNATSNPSFVWNRIGSGSWSSSGSWNLGVAPVGNAATKLEFFTGLTPSGSITANNDVGSNFTLRSLSLKGNGSGTTILTGGSISLTAGASMDIGSDGISYTLGMPISLGGALAIGGTGNDTVVFNGIVSGSGTLTKSGPSTLSFSANNTMTGGLVLDGGTIRHSTDQTTALASLTFGAGNGSGNTSTLDLATTPASLTAGSLTVRSATSGSNSLRVGAGETLSITGAVDVSTSAASSSNGAKLVFNPSGAVANSTFRVTGSGSFIVGKNNSTESTTRNTLMDLRNLASFMAGTSTTPLAAFQTGYYTAQASNYEDYGVNATYLAPASVIYATTFGVGDMNGGVGGKTESALYLGAGASEIHTTTLTVGEAQNLNANGAGTMKWNSGVTSGSLLLAGTGTLPAITNMYVGSKVDTGSSTDHSGTVDFTNGVVTGSITNLYVGHQTANGGSSSPATFGTFRIGGGTGGSSLLNIASLYLGYQATSSTGFPTSGTFVVGGGTVNVANNVEVTRTAGGIASLQITGGTLSVGGNLTSGGGTSSLTLNGGTLDMTGGTIGDAVNGIGTLTFSSGTLRNVATINGTGGLTKTGSATLVLDGTIGHAGTTTISAGTLRVGASSGTNTSTSLASSASIVNNGVLIFRRTDAAETDLANSISGTGVVMYEGSAVINQSRYPANNASTYSGGTVISNSRVNLANLTGLGSGSVTVNNGASLYVTATGGSVNNPLSIAGIGWAESAGQLGALRLTSGSSWAGAVTLAANSRICTSSGIATLAGGISGPFSLEIGEDTAAGTLVLGGTNTYTGNTTVSFGTLDLAATGSLRFTPGANGVCNRVTGAATASFKGSFVLDLSSAAIASGNAWTLVNAATLNETYAATFQIPGFTENTNVWTMVDGAKTWTFNEVTGVLSLAVTLPGITVTQGYAAWLDGFPAPTDTSFSGDPDKDGISTLLEYVLDGNPGLPGTFILPTISVTPTTMVFTFKRRDDSETETLLSFEYGTMPGTWFAIPIEAAGSGPDAQGVTVLINENGAAADQISVSVPKDSRFQLFGRLRVSASSAAP